MERNKNTPMYNKRVWLNDSKSPSTGSIVCYYGPDIWDPGKVSMFIEISSCSSIARLHQAGTESKEKFIKKAVKLRDELNAFIEFMVNK